MFLNDLVPEALKQNGDLNSPSCNNVIKADCTPTVRFEEYHQEPESDEYHHVYVLEEAVLVESLAEILVTGTRVDSFPERGASAVQNHYHQLGK